MTDTIGRSESPSHSAGDHGIEHARLTASKVRARRVTDFLRATTKSPTTLIGGVAIMLIVLMAIFAPLIVPENPFGAYQLPRDWANIDAPPGSPGHPLGTNREGGDVLYGIVWGARLSMRLAFTVIGAAVLIGTIYGSTAALLGGRWDERLMRLVDVFQAVPELIFALAIAGALGPSFGNIIIALIITMWPPFARLARGEVLKIKGMEYVEAARVGGFRSWRIFRQDILPNIVTAVMVAISLYLGKIVLTGATLSFIGLAEGGLAEWGNLVSSGQSGILAGHWWTATFGGAVIFIWALGCNLFGDGIRDLLDPKTSHR